jgi:hypothetical protein
MPQNLTQAPEWLLDYDRCSLEELRTFIEDRTGAAVNEREILAAHLRKMDQTRKFPRFVELPPELRINVYEALLVDNRARDEKGWLKDERDKCRLHTAVLRTSKQVYSEARPVLYDRNKFNVMIGYTWKGSRPGSAQLGRDRIGLRVVRPGARFSYHKLIGSADCPSPLELSLLGWQMLRGLKHVTVDLGLVTPEPPTEDSSDDLYDDWDEKGDDGPFAYAVHAREAMTAARLNPQRLGLGLLVFVEVHLDKTTPDVFARFAKAVQGAREVLECHMVAGGFDYLIKARVADISAYRRFLGDTLLALPGVRETHTYAVMEEVKRDAPLPVV